MDMDARPTPPASEGAVRRPLRAAVWLCTAGAAAAVLLCGWVRKAEPAPQPAAAPAAGQVAAKNAPRLFRSWPRERKPDLVLLLTGQVYGYLQPCGCSDPQYGGLERRYNFVQGLLRERGWPVVAADLGDVPQKSVNRQALLKYRYIMESMKRIGYSAAGIGETEIAQGLMNALAEYALNNPSPRVVSANLVKTDPSGNDKFPGMLASFEVVARPGLPTVAFVGATGKSVAGIIKKDPDAQFGDADKALHSALADNGVAEAELRVLLFQGDLAEAKAVAQRFPQFQVVQCLTLEEEPPGRPNVVGTTWVIEVGHKGRHLGTVGAYRTGRPDRPFELYYESVMLGPEFRTPDALEAGHPILTLFEDYAREVKRANYLATEYPKILHPMQQAFPEAKYVGSEACKSCHRESYQIWKASPHSHAYQTLVDARRPGLRQYDGECVRCHVTGFDYQTGFTSESATAKLKDNGCENCHGPCSLHVQDKANAALFPYMNPCKTKPNETPQQKAARENRLNDSCMKCHDTDNDVHWDLKKWVEGKIVHKETTE